MLKLELLYILIQCSVIILSVKFNPFSQEHIDYLNTKQNSWTAGKNFHYDTPLSHVSRFAGSRYSSKVGVEVKSYDDQDIVIPDTFDARTNWPLCKSLWEVPVQSACGSDWATSTASAMTDRMCIHSNSKWQHTVSAGNLVICNNACSGCKYGYTLGSWYWWNLYGIVTGGFHNTTGGCVDYPYPPCVPYDVVSSYPPCPTEDYDDIICEKTCDESAKLNYLESLTYGSYYFLNNSMKTIQVEIMTNGPLSTTFDLYSDFPNYKTGVYEAVSTTQAEFMGAFSVRLLGWGTENKKDYWLGSNNWGEDWGDKGFFKILRGVNHLHIEETVTAGMPDYNRTRVKP